jgi:hypothetical protein
MFFLLLGPVHSQAQTPSIKSTANVAENITCRLVNGDRVSGQALMVSGTDVKVETIFAGIITLRASAILSCYTTEERLRNELSRVGIAMSPPMASAAAAASSPQQTSTSSKGVPSPPTTSILQKPSSDSEWKRILSLNYAFSLGNSNTSDFSISGGLIHQGSRGRFQVATLLRRMFKDGVAFGNLFTATVHLDQKTGHPKRSGGSSYFTEAAYEQDQLKKLDHRLFISAGVSVPVLKKKTAQVSIDFGSGVTREIFSTGSHRTIGNGLIRFAGEQSMSRRIQFKQQFSLYPEFSTASRYRMVADCQLHIPLNKYLSLNIRTLDRFDSRPQGGVKSNDFSLLSGIGLQF